VLDICLVTTAATVITFLCFGPALLLLQEGPHHNALGHITPARKRMFHHLWVQLGELNAVTPRVEGTSM
jgi:hypothetical protein